MTYSVHAAFWGDHHLGASPMSAPDLGPAHSGGSLGRLIIRRRFTWPVQLPSAAHLGDALRACTPAGAGLSVGTITLFGFNFTPG
jgi:hypothetical protein